MAWEVPSFVPGGLTASATLASKQFYWVKVSGDNTVAVCDADGEFAIGIVQNNPAANEGASVEMNGVSKLLFGEAITAGQFVGTDNAGKGKRVEITNTGADVGDWALAVCLEGAGSDEYGTVKLLVGMRVEAT